MQPIRILAALCVAPWLVSLEEAQETANTSGASLTPEASAYDVLHYNLALRVDPGEQSIAGTLTMRARLVRAAKRIHLDLDERLTVTAVRSGSEELSFTHEGGAISIDLPGTSPVQVPGTAIEIAVDYEGQPREAPRPPWDGGFTWSETADGSPWIATSCQGEGADLWWPCKDHPSDEADSMDLFITVPEPLVVASNGRLVSVEPAGEGERTYHWHVSTPINNYGVALNIAPYATIEEDYESTSGDTFPVTYWVLPENLEKGKQIFPEFVAHLRFFEELFGPYPFRADKYGVAETPHLGMEHQTIIAYGNQYRGGPSGFDWLHHHELSHEWWANLVTAPDWNDMWIHEGFATYSQALYAERLHGPEGYRKEMEAKFARIRNRNPVAPRGTQTTADNDGDVYFKGSWTLHTLRWLIGNDALFESLRRMAYPDPLMERTTDGSACRFATTDDFKEIVEGITDRDLDWFFEVYLRQAELPKLVQEKKGGKLHLRWEVPGDLPFPMPVQVVIGEDSQRVEMPRGEAVVRVPTGATPDVDPLGWILKTE